MKHLKQFFLLVFVIPAIPSSTFAQAGKDSLAAQKQSGTQDSIARKVLAYANNKFALARPFNVEYTNMSPYRYASKLEGTSLPESKATRFSQLKLSTNFNLIRKKTWLLGATIAYRYTDIGANLVGPGSTAPKSVDGQFHYHASALNFTYFSKLFNKTTIYTGSLMVDGSEKHFERLTGLVTGTIILKANARTKVAVGMVISVDPSAQLPFIPTFTYEHKFNNGLIADMILPKQLLLRKVIHKNGRLSLGTELDRSGFYLYNLDPNNPSQKYEYRQVDLNNGLVYEHLIGSHFVATARTGIRATISSGIFEKEKKFGDAVFETTPKPGFYFNIGLSYNPFIKKKTK
ncbi:MAG: hypothetical protein J0I41_04610 [Filimonas sp.]|nr:hypothetical protein [Filimonas sp.]